MTSVRVFRLLVALGVVTLPGRLLADDRAPVPEPPEEEVAPGPGWPDHPVHCLKDLRGLAPYELERLFCQASCADCPVGCCRGRVLYLCDAKHPRLQARMAGAVWKGKCFAEDGTFVNQWAGFRAIHSEAGGGESWLDGGPCLVMEYAPGTPLFANSRDEVRQIAPGLYLGLMWDREPHPRLRGYFALEREPDKAHHHH
jgi:hypothetical protein